MLLLPFAVHHETEVDNVNTVMCTEQVNTISKCKMVLKRLLMLACSSTALNLWPLLTVVVQALDLWLEFCHRDISWCRVVKVPKPHTASNLEDHVQCPTAEKVSAIKL